MNFDRLAPFYRAMEFLSAGRKLQDCRTRFIREIKPPRRILLAGEGHGRSLPVFLETFPDARVTVVDSSQRMLEIAKRGAVGEISRVEFIHADLSMWDGPEAVYDLIVTNFFLDCFGPETLPAVVERLAKTVTPDADWLLADFHIPEKGIARWRARVIVGMLYRFFRMTCGLDAGALVSTDGPLKAAGFHQHARVNSDWGLLKSEWWRREGL